MAAKLPTEPFPPMTPLHEYKSTSCHHNQHEDCRKKCKWCPAKCNCSCHIPKPKPPRNPERTALIVVSLAAALLAGVVIALGLLVATGKL